jgi:CheY-like chemotaxis protein
MEKKHILVVDDQPTMRLMLRKFLEPAGHRVSEAKDAETALALVSSDPPDVVLLDLKMPGCSGHEILKKMKADKTFKSPVMVLTGQTDWQSVDACIAEGADAYMAKPVTRDQLLRKLEEILTPKPK